MNILKIYNNIRFHFKDCELCTIKILPTVVYPNGNSEYWSKSPRSPRFLHRHWSEGPAMIYENGDEIYYYNGKRHRPSSSSDPDSGPATIQLNKMENTNNFGRIEITAYYLYGKFHRDLSDGPALILVGDSTYYVNGRKISM
ncbi:MAG: hypothetical protein JKX76_02235 [Colwellia sp.]|nr:hypothetical protein [Colwellia sp.]